MMRCFVVGFVLAAGVSAMAGEVEHTVHPGESVSLISQRYYGDFDGAEILRRYNGLGDATIRPGQTLRVPYSEIHEIRPGDSWSVLARRYLGSVSAWPAIAVLNDRPPEAPLTVGLRVRMPVVLSRGQQVGRHGCQQNAGNQQHQGMWKARPCHCRSLYRMFLKHPQRQRHRDCPAPSPQEEPTDVPAPPCQG